MAKPNLLSLTNIEIDTIPLLATTVDQDLIPALAANHSMTVDAIFATNIHATVVGQITVTVHKNGSPTLDYKLANQERVPLKQKINILLGKPLYLSEGDSVSVKAVDANTVNVFAVLSDMS